MEKVIVRLDSWRHPALRDILSGEPGLDLVQCDPTDEERTAAAFERAHLYQISSTRDELPTRWHAAAPLLDGSPNLLCVSTSGAGYDTVDVAACTERGVLVVNQAGGNALAVAEMTIAMTLALSRRLVETDRRLRRERGFARTDLMGSDVAGKTIGLVGVGHVGTRVARLARAFDMRVIACDPFLSDAEIERRGAEPLPFADILSQSDFVSLHCPRTADTTGMMNAERFALMKAGAFFISTARGGIHDEAALADALASGHVAGAGLDVWDQEPPPLDHPLLRSDKVIASYHLAGVTHEARTNMAVFAAEQMVAVLRGRRPPRPVNPEVWPAYTRRFEAILGVAPVRDED